MIKHEYEMVRIVKSELETKERGQRRLLIVKSVCASVHTDIVDAHAWLIVI